MCVVSRMPQEQEEGEVVVVVVIMKAAQRSVIFRISIGSFIQRHSFFFWISWRFGSSHNAQNTTRYHDFAALVKCKSAKRDA